MGTRISFTAAILLSLALAACANPEAKQASMQAAQAEADAKDDATCREKGLDAGTEPYEACRNSFGELPPPTKPRHRSGGGSNFRRRSAPARRDYTGR